MSDIDDLIKFADEADRRGDKEAAFAAMNQIEALSSTKKPDTFYQAMIEPNIGFVYGLGRGVRSMAGGLAQTGLEIGEKVGLASPGAAQRFTSDFDKTTAENEMFLGSQSPWFREGVSVGTPLGKIAPALATPAGPVKFLPSLAYNAALGGGLSATEYIPESERAGADRGEMFKKGALLSGAFRTAVGGVQALPRALRRVADSATGKEGQALEDATGVSLTIGQKAGHETLSEIERGTLGGERGAKIISDQLIAAEKYMENTAVSFSKNATVSNIQEKAGSGLVHAANQAKIRIERVRSVTSNRAYGDFKRAVGDGPTIPIDNFRKAASELSDIAAPATPEARAASQSVLNTIDAQIEKGSGKITADQLLSWQQKISKELFQNLDRQGKAFSQKKLMDALNSDVNAYSGKASDLLKNATRMYARGSEQLRKIEDTAIEKFIGKTVDPFKAAEKYGKLSPAEIMQVNILLGKQSGALEDIQANVIMSAIQKSSLHPERLAGKSQLSPNEFISYFPSRQHFDAIFSDSPAKKEAVMNGIKVMQRVADKNAQGAQGMGVRQTFADFLGNAAGGNPIFIARLAGKVFGPLGLRWALFSENGKRTMQVLARSNPKSAAYANAFNTMIENTDDVSPEKDQ